MKERGILYQGAMVRALLADLKTQTRRMVKPALSEAQWVEERDDGFYVCADGEPTCYAGVWETHEYAQVSPIRCPYGQPGDRLWVRETSRCIGQSTDFMDRKVLFDVDYKASGGTSFHFDLDAEPRWFPRVTRNVDGSPRWQPGIHMPRWASRITLEVTGVRVERLQDISEADAIAEGIHKPVGSQFWHSNDLAHLWDGGGGLPGDTPQRAYRSLWNSINLPPSPVQERIGGKLVTVAYVSYPWSMEDFEHAYPGVAASGLYRGKPLTVTPNPWVWVISFRRNT